MPAAQTPAQRSNRLPPCTSPRAGLGTGSARGSPVLVAQDSRSRTAGAQLVPTALCQAGAPDPAPFCVPAPGAGSVAGRELVAGTAQCASEATLCQPVLSRGATAHSSPRGTVPVTWGLAPWHRPAAGCCSCLQGRLRTPRAPGVTGGHISAGLCAPWSSPGCPTARSTWGCAGVRSFRARLAPPAPSPLQGHEQSPDCSASRSGLCPLTGLD